MSENEPTVGRLIVDNDASLVTQASGAMNMAVDETLLRSVAESGVPTLRFYTWQPATLSLGYFQTWSDRDQHQASIGCDAVRRASGGGAILHDHELTYCLATPSRQRFGGAQHYYDAFHQTLVQLLADYSVAAHLQGPDNLTDDAFLCFQRRSVGDVLLRQAKIGGSAQRRWKQALVQHGSVLLRSSAYAPELPGIAELSDTTISEGQLATDWLEKLQQRLKIAFEPAVLTDIEHGDAQRLAAEKFSGDWRARRR